MRPITLDMQGFASFRDEAHVDFTDADFFALVGPTGSGKSTVIDAMTFAQRCPDTNIFKLHHYTNSCHWMFAASFR